MIVYRAQQQEVKTVAYLEGIGRVFRRVEQSGCTSHEHVTELLIDCGEFEAAVADLLSTDANLVHPTMTLLRQVSRPVGHLFRCSWERTAGQAGRWAARLADAWEKLAAHSFPPVLQIRVPEGYAYYSLYPEAYLEAAHRFCDEVKPHEVTCIGIRSIGTSLSTVVAAALAGQRHTPLMLKFVGLGRCGRAAHARAKQLYEAGFHPPVLGLIRGFLLMQFVPGQPLTVHTVDGSFLDHGVRYLEYLSRMPATGIPMPQEELIRMIEVNITEGLGAA